MPGEPTGEKQTAKKGSSMIHQRRGRCNVGQPATWDSWWVQVQFRDSEHKSVIRTATLLLAEPFLTSSSQQSSRPSAFCLRTIRSSLPSRGSLPTFYHGCKGSALASSMSSKTRQPVGNHGVRTISHEPYHTCNHAVWSPPAACNPFLCLRRVMSPQVPKIGMLATIVHAELNPGPAPMA